MPRNIQLLVIDPQNDFCEKQQGGKAASLYVDNAEQHMGSVARLVDRVGHKLTAIRITLDSHQEVDISHPLWYVDDNGKPAPAFTVMKLEGNPSQVRLRDGSKADIPGDHIIGYDITGAKLGRFRTRQAGASGHTMWYLHRLADSNRYPHMIWPPHCHIGEWGHNVIDSLHNATREWARKEYAVVDYLTKGSNQWSEHFSAVQAEVPDPEDPSTQVNMQGLVTPLEEADQILFAGEALSHCVANTGLDIVNNFSDPSFVRKITLLRDATGPVANCEGMADAFLADPRMKGMDVSDTQQVIATL
jgi:nicotinamidase-related amidase